MLLCVETSVYTQTIIIKEAHSQDQNSLDNLYIPTTTILTTCFFVFGDSGPSADTCFNTERCTCSQPAFISKVNICAKHLPLMSTHCLLKTCKVCAVSKTSRQTSITCCTGHILCGHVAIIMKPYPPFPICHVVMVQALLPIFLHGCEIKPGGSLGTRRCTP